ncbi:MAG: ABC transporter permease subunit [Vulcanimicrobiota bacterium]
MLAIYRRELAAYFNSSLAWVLMAIYLFVLGLIFTGMVNSYSQYSMSAGMNPFMARSVNVMDDLVVPVQWWMGFLMLFILPLLTMRLIAEESRSGTLEMLFTYPLTEWQIVGGKFFAAQTVVATMLAFSSVSVVMLSRLTDIEWKLIGSGYLGLLLLGAAFTAFGLWASSTTSSQMIAAVVSYGGLMASWLIMILDDQITAVKETFGDLSMMSHVEAMARGNVSTHNIVYYLAWTALFLFLTVRILESRKWRL